MRHLAIGSATLLSLSLGCVSATSEQPALSEAHAESDAEPTPAEFVRNGLRFTPLRANHPEKYVYRVPTDTTPQPALDWKLLSDEQWADATTALTLYRGWIYRTRAEPERLQQARTGLAQRMARRDAILEAARPPAGVDSAESAPLARLVIGADDRQPQRDNTAYPWRTIAQLQSEQGVCSGVIIGATTGLTAAHCLYDGQNYRSLFTWRPGADGLDEDRTPFGEHSCYLASVPEGSGTLQTITLDYGVADFAAGDCEPRTQPGYSGGTMEPFIFDDDELRNQMFQLYGYPGVDDFNQPLEMFGHSGSIHTPLPDQIWFDMDGEGGQSGSPVFYWGGWGSALIGGLYSGGTNDLGYSRNHGARITQRVLAFIEVFSEEF